MIIKTPVDYENVLSAPGLVGDKLLNSDNLEFVKLSIEPDSEIAPHSMPMKVIFYLISGTGLLSFDGTEHNIEKGSIVECEPEQERGWKNIGDDMLEVLVVKVS